ncbi:hypothetical protein SLS62_004083 [Diatrype stigma]|uniref:Flavoprotein domain-containing protein n=1 Tax=Diatrype stigma TaxID=117547 RepID=A0AAN9URH5_9PEZI
MAPHSNKSIPSTIKLPNIIQALSVHHDLSIRVLLTPSAARFLAGQSPEQPSLASLTDLPNVDGVYGDTDEWRQPWTRGNAILHIELRRWADILVIAPLSANTLAKIVGGMADGILTSVVRAWDARGELDSDVLALREGQQGTGSGDGVGVPGEAEAPPLIAAAAEGLASGGSGSNVASTRRITKKKHIIVAPAMNTAMWRHPVTAKQIRVLEKEWGVGNQESGRNSEEVSTEHKNDAAAATLATTSTVATSRTQHLKDRNGHHDDYDSNEPRDEEEGGWFEVLRPQTKLLMCGDRGDGAMREWTEIVRVIEDRLGLN